MRRDIRNPVLKSILYVLAFSLSVFHILLATVILIDSLKIVAFDLMIAMALIFCLYPASGWSPKERISFLDGLLSVAAMLVGIYTISQHEAYMYRLGQPNIYDIVMGSIATLLTLEAARRTTGFSLPLITGLSILYCFFGNYAPGMFLINPIGIGRVVSHLFCGLQGIYGTVLIVVSTIVFLFIIFAAFLRGSAVGDFFIDISYSLVGKMTGGPAKLAVLASGLMGMLSGAGAANVAATGNFTIPLMKKYGYKPHVAGAIEAAASTGGQLLPPIMGATAFVMSQITGIPYSKICIVSVLPGFLYVFSVMIYVHLEAKKSFPKTIGGSNISQAKEILIKRGHLIVPIIVLTYLILNDFSLPRAAMVSIASVVLVSLFRKETRMNVKAILWSLKEAGIDMLMLISAGACAGIILGVVSLSGLGLKFSSIFLSAAGENIFAMLCLIGLVSVIFGMGLPVVASYIVLATLAGPALETLGVPVLIAHLVIFWFSVDANVTPPVAIAAYVAAGVANSKIMPTAWESWKAAKGLYIVPFLMVYSPLISGNLLQKIEVTIMAALGMIAASSALKGYLFRPTLVFERVLLVIAALFLFLPGSKGYLPLTHLVGLVLFSCLAFISKRMFKHLRIGEMAREP